MENYKIFGRIQHFGNSSSMVRSCYQWFKYTNFLPNQYISSTKYLFFFGTEQSVYTRSTNYSLIKNSIFWHLCACAGRINEKGHEKEKEDEEEYFSYFNNWYWCLPFCHRSISSHPYKNLSTTVQHIALVCVKHFFTQWCAFTWA